MADEAQEFADVMLGSEEVEITATLELRYQGRRTDWTDEDPSIMHSVLQAAVNATWEKLARG